MKRLMQVFFALVIIAPLTVVAQQSPWGAKAEERAKAREQAKTHPTGQHPDSRAVHHHHDPNGDPRGWDHAQKVGWQGRGLPPEQRKHVNDHHHDRFHRGHHHHDWERDHHRFRHDHDRH